MYKKASVYCQNGIVKRKDEKRLALVLYGIEDIKKGVEGIKKSAAVKKKH